MLTIPFTVEPPGHWLHQKEPYLWKITRNVERARQDCRDRGEKEHPKLCIKTKARPSIVFSSEELMADDSFPTYLALPLYSYQGVMGEDLVEALPYAVHVPGHPSPTCSLQPGFGNFGQMFPFKKEWLDPIHAEKFTTAQHPQNPICRLSEAMMGHIIDRFAAYLSTLAGLPLK